MMCHRLAKAYGRLPHEIATLDPMETAFNLACYRHAAEDRADRLTKVSADSKGLIFPIVDPLRFDEV